MNKTIKSTLLVVGIGLLAYGIYLLVIPEASLDLGFVNVETQDNTNAYITISFGLAALFAGIMAGKKA